ncbi:MBL fold metallo-hydrolase [Brevibacterium yomogidense]|uniref:MBL fold metallo-hydrolase n=1 Tax=Brevibacterium yomogidense TaxID=946573 RepID=UPI0018E00483|nr:MBL fold metallo-hydrolase [Brevibacterium yomogidense]
MAVFTLVTDPVRLTSVLVVGSSRALLVDTGSGPDQAVRILAALRQITDLPLVVANTHDHWDHFFGNATLAEAGVTEFLASHAFVRDSPGSAWLQHAEASEHAFDLPDPTALAVDVRAVEDGERLSLSGLQNGDGDGPADSAVEAGDAVEFFVVSGHTDTDLAIRVGPVMIVGDLLEEGAPPQVGIDSTPVAWVRSLERLLEVPGVDVFVPGHGRPVGRGFAEAQRTDLAAFAASEDADDTDDQDALPARFAADAVPADESGAPDESHAATDAVFGVRVTRIV